MFRIFEKNRTLPGITDRHNKIIDERIEYFQAELELYLAKRSLDDKKYDDAKKHLKLANAHLKRPKLQFILALLSVAPPLARALNNYRKKSRENGPGYAGRSWDRGSVFKHDCVRRHTVRRPDTYEQESLDPACDA